MRPLIHVVEQHAEEAAFLWETRRRAVNGPHFRLGDLARLDDRIDAHLDGLRVAGPAGFEVTQEQLAAYGGPGEAFVAAVVAFEATRSSRQVRDRLARICRGSHALAGARSALGWLPVERTSEVMTPLLTSADRTLRGLALGGFRLHRRDPGGALRSALSERSEVVRGEALRVVGELGLSDQEDALFACIDDVSSHCAFWATWSLSLRTARAAALQALSVRAEAGGIRSERAAALLVRRLPLGTAREWLMSRISAGADRRTCIVAAGCLGNPSVVPWLIEQMDDVATARISGDALSLITGVEIVHEKLERLDPPSMAVGPTEDPADENVAMDPDLELPWPDRALIQGWWAAHSGQFAKDTRHLLGRPASRVAAQAALESGYQRQRAAAAEELCLYEPEKPLFAIGAPAARQRARLLAG